MSDLDLPFIATIPYHVQSDDHLPDAAKIFFGQITGLSVKCGYIWATNEQFAKMKKTSEKNIERWLMILEERGFIRRETSNVHVKGDDGKWNWQKKRRIFITDAFKEKVNKSEGFEPPKNEESIEPPKNEESIEPPKNEGIINNPLDSNLKQQSSCASRIVGFPECLDQLDLEPKLKTKICEENSLEQIQLAVDRCLKWKGRPSDAVGVMSALKRADTWEDSESPEKIIDNNIKYLSSLKNLDGVKIAHNAICICSKYIEFSQGSKCTMFSVDDKDFIKLTGEFIEKLRMWEAENLKK